MANNTSQHILGTSANLLGFCLFVITSLHIGNKAESSLIDELTSLVAMALTISCIFSYVSIRSKNKLKEERLETIADYFFISSLIGIFVIISLITLDFIS
jgi:hypothetical protein